MANAQIDAGMLMAKIHEQGARIAELELIRDALDANLSAAQARIAELEGQLAPNVPGELVDGGPEPPAET